MLFLKFSIKVIFIKWLDFKMYRKRSKTITNEYQVINYYDLVPMCPILKCVRNNKKQQNNVSLL